MENIDLDLGEVKPSVDGEKKGNKIRHGDYESTPGTTWVVEMYGDFGEKPLFSIMKVFLYIRRKKGGNVEHGAGRRPTLISTKRL